MGYKREGENGRQPRPNALSIFGFYKDKVKMADNLGPMAWLFLPENELPQWQQKIALRAENTSSQKKRCF